MTTDTEGKLLIPAEYSSKSPPYNLVSRCASAIRLSLHASAGLRRGRFAICDLFVSSRSTRVVYGLADPGVTGLPHITVAVIRFVVVLPLSVM
jgi:hypothetical protein